MTIGGIYLDALLILSICLLAARYGRTLAKYDGWLMRGFVIWLLLGSLANSALVLTNALAIFIATEIIFGTAILRALIRTRSAFTGTQRHIQAVLYFSAQAQLIPTIIEIALLLKTIIAPDYPIIYLILAYQRHSMRKRMESERARRENTFVRNISSRINLSTSGPSRSSASRANTERPSDTPIPPSLAYHPNRTSLVVLPVMPELEEGALQYSDIGVISGSLGGSKGDEKGDEKDGSLSFQRFLEEG